MEQFTSVRHRLLVTSHIAKAYPQEISQDLFIQRIFKISMSGIAPVNISTTPSCECETMHVIKIYVSIYWLGHRIGESVIAANCGVQSPFSRATGGC